MANKNPKPPPKQPGTAKQLRIRLPDTAWAELEAATPGQTKEQRTLTLSRWLMLGLETERQMEAAMQPPPTNPE